MYYIIISQLLFLFLIFKLILVIKNHQLKSVSFFVIVFTLVLMFLSVLFGSKIEVFPKALVQFVIYKTPYFVFILFSSMYILLLIIKKSSRVILNSILISLLIFAIYQILIGFPLPELMRVE